MKLGVFVVCGALAGGLVGADACTSTTGGTVPDPIVGSGSALKKGSAGGFSASLSADLKEDGSGTSGSGTSGTGTGSSMSGSGTGSATRGSGSATQAGSATSGPTTTMSGSAAKSPPDAAGSGAGSGKASAGKPVVATVAPFQNGSAAVGPTRPSDTRHHVNPPADLAAIKLDLEPNWDRDFDEVGTISFVLKVPNGTDTRVFAFHYGYDLPNAPADREAYKKFLADQKVLTVTLDRQRGAAWYLEGTDGGGSPAFRYLVLYGGKRLVCGGSLYKDKDSTALGPDLRDKVVAAAKKICETLLL